MKYIFSTLLLFTSPLFAAEKPALPVYELELTEPLSTQKLIEKSHEVIEGEESGKFFTNWRENFRFGKKFRDSYRWIALNRAEEVKNIALDSVVLFGMSHSLEMMSGPLLVGVGLSQGWPEWLVSALGFGGAVISVPGLDPLCMLMFGTYYRSEKFRNAIRTLRFGVVKGVRTAADRVGLLTLLQRHFARVDIREFLENKPGLARMQMYEEKVVFNYELKTGSQVRIRVNLEAVDGRAYLTRAEYDLTGATAEELKALRKSLKQFGWNTGDALRRAFDAVVAGEKASAFYVRAIKTEEKTQVYEYVENAVTLSSPVRWRSSGQACRALFTL